jgi:HAD superfamily hydrolase (TIGR01509 family)
MQLMAQTASSIDTAPEPSRIRAIILDFDGTIVDTETPTFVAWRRLYRQYGFELNLRDWKDTVGSNTGFDPTTRLAELAGWETVPANLLRQVERDISTGCDQEPLRPGVRALLADIEDAGLGVAIASSSPSGWVLGWLEHHGLTSRFEVVVCRDHVDRTKPAPDLYLLAARRLGLEPSDCVVIEDSPLGFQAARAAGMACVVVPNALTARLRFPDGAVLHGTCPRLFQINERRPWGKGGACAR